MFRLGAQVAVYADKLEAEESAHEVSAVRAMAAEESAMKVGTR
jgi:hypothetical protein